MKRNRQSLHISIFILFLFELTLRGENTSDDETVSIAEHSVKTNFSVVFGLVMYSKDIEKEIFSYADQLIIIIRRVITSSETVHASFL